MADLNSNWYIIPQQEGRVRIYNVGKQGYLRNTEKKQNAQCRRNLYVEEEDHEKSIKDENSTFWSVEFEKLE